MARTPEDAAFEDFAARYEESRASLQPPAPGVRHTVYTASVMASADLVTRHFAARRPPLPDFDGFELDRPPLLRRALDTLFARPAPPSRLEDIVARVHAPAEPRKGWFGRRR